MNKNLFRFRLAGILAAAVFLVESAAAQGQKSRPMHYTVTDLGLANGSTPGQPSVIKNNGLIAEATDISNAWHATLSFLGRQIDLAKTGGLGGPNSSAFDVNAWGQAVGEAETQDSDPKLEDFYGFGSQRVCKAFVWQNGVMSALPPLKDATRPRPQCGCESDQHSGPGWRRGREHDHRLDLPSLQSQSHGPAISDVRVQTGHLE